jgi:outer membrane murein-binding lipoprotein Lpp
MEQSNQITAAINELTSKVTECMNVVNNVRAKQESRLTNAAKANAYQDAINIILKHVTKTTK